jgi:hypothetical protein
MDHSKDAEFLNKPIMNYTEMQIIFFVGLAIGKFAMGSNEPFDSPAPSPKDATFSHE